MLPLHQEVVLFMVVGGLHQVLIYLILQLQQRVIQLILVQIELLVKDPMLQASAIQLVVFLSVLKSILLILLLQIL